MSSGDSEDYESAEDEVMSKKTKSQVTKTGEAKKNLSAKESDSESGTKTTNSIPESNTQKLVEIEPEDASNDWDDFGDDWEENSPKEKDQIEQKATDTFRSTASNEAKDGAIKAESDEKANENDTGNDWDDFGDDDAWEDSVPQKGLHQSEIRAAGSATEATGASTIKSTTEMVVAPPARSTWSVLKPWGGVVTSFISSATEGVSLITSQVGGLSLSSIENSIGVPDPEELARRNKEAKAQNSEESSKSSVGDSPDSLQQEDNILPNLGHFVSGVTTIGNRVISGGLDTLEGIGKKTMTILQENDPLLLNKRKMLGLQTEKAVLSQVLREAKAKSEEIESNLKQIQKQSYKKQLHFETLFDNYYGLVHLEALEMLSNQSTIKLQSLVEPLTGKALTEIQETLNEVKELCDLGDIENNETEVSYETVDLDERFKEAVEDLGIQIEFNDLISCWQKNSSWLNETTNAEPQEIYEKGLKCLAETCALTICKMHKIAEMLLIKEHHSTANEADSLVQLTHVFCKHVNGIANCFGRRLDGFEKTEEINSLITSIFLEVYNSLTYIQNGFQLLIPILQIGAA